MDDSEDYALLNEFCKNNITLNAAKNIKGDSLHEQVEDEITSKETQLIEKLIAPDISEEKVTIPEALIIIKKRREYKKKSGDIPRVTNNKKSKKI